MYFSIQRIATLIVGLVIIGMVVFTWSNDTESTAALYGKIVFLILGGYILIAAIIPHRTVSEEIGNEVVVKVMFEWPIKLLIRSVSKISDFF